MKICLNNIGNIKETNIIIDGITVIAGENNTGKSTVCKALYSMFNGFYNIEDKVYKERINSISSALQYSHTKQGDIFFDIPPSLRNEIAIGVISKFRNKEFNDEDIKKYIEDKGFSHGRMENLIIPRISEILKISDEKVISALIARIFTIEFNAQVRNISSNHNGDISLFIKTERFYVEFNEKNNIINFSYPNSLNNEAVYLDDPFVLDELRIKDAFLEFFTSTIYANHREQLVNKLSQEDDNNIIEGIVVEKRLQKIYEKVDEICNGYISQKKNQGWIYMQTEKNKGLNVKNLSTGLKTFVILKTLLKKGFISFNGTILLDEPEIHLHPQWQIVFAEIIVLLHKEFQMHILLSTHSPYFLRAIEVYAKKYNVNQMCHFYLAELCGKEAKINEVTEDVSDIYKKLFKPFQDLEDEDLE